MVPWDRLVYHIISPGPSLGAAVSPCPLCRTTSPWRWEHSHLVIHRGAVGFLPWVAFTAKFLFSLESSLSPSLQRGPITFH